MDFVADRHPAGPSARYIFRVVVRKRLIVDDSCADTKGVAVRSNRSRAGFATREEAARLVDAGPAAQWRLLFILNRCGGLRRPF